MADRLSPEHRSWLMGQVRGRNTSPEIAVRKAAHGLGYRFRLHRKDLPGTPDLVFPRLRKVIFVHGCFWHRHRNCRLASFPKTRQEFWEAKFRRNVERDEQAVADLERLGWDVKVIWQCDTTKTGLLEKQIAEFLGPRERAG